MVALKRQLGYAILAIGGWVAAGFQFFGQVSAC